MLDNVASERDTALNELRRAGEGGGSGGGNGDGAQEEVERLRDECDLLRDQVGLASCSSPSCFLARTVVSLSRSCFFYVS